MAKYFIDKEIYFQNIKQPPRKVLLPVVIANADGQTALCYDEDGNNYTLNISEIFEDNT